MDAAAGPLVLARHELLRGRADLALAALERVTGSELESVEFWSLRAHALYALRRWDEAVTAAQTGLERTPDDLELLDMLALAELERGRKREAQEMIDAAIARHPDSAVLHAHRALILARSGRKSVRVRSFKQARAAVEEALRLDPDCEPALRVRALIAVLSHDRRASEYSAELLSLHPEDERAHLIAGSALARRGQVSAGLRHQLEAARLDPSDPRIAWLGRRSRVLQGRFTAPLLFAQRVTRGRLQLVWVFVVLVTLGLHQPWLTAAVFSFWVYTWAARLYLRMRVGKAPQ